MEAFGSKHMTGVGLMAMQATTVVRIQAMPSIVADRILQSLSQEGVVGEAMSDGACFELRVAGPDGRRLSSRVAAALDRLVVSEGRPLVPEQIGPASFVLRPAAG